MKSHLKDKVPQGFTTATAEPTTPEQWKLWQQTNRGWWESNPMRYDWRTKIPAADFTPEFYAEIDRRFFDDVRTYMPWSLIPFDPLIDFEGLQGKDVLEIGVGNGSHAQLLASHSRSFTGIDLTEYAVHSTSARLKLRGLNGKVVRMDAEHLDFADASFDFVWSWGVIHHSANTGQILREIHRVLRPHGAATIMVYHRSFWNAFVVAGLLHGILQGELWKTRSIHMIMQKWTDGALARFYTIEQWKDLVGNLFAIQDLRIYGSKAEAIPIPSGRLKDFVARLVPDSLTRAWLNMCQMGSMLVCTVVKESRS
ncbi:MAG TPA: class I SAM-dependent methyltransferase [Verrucomicrobiae bacterium]|nr:class I SAM-dependent methyltransferase [Verrucomicrobiae bacterium]